MALYYLVDMGALSTYSNSLVHSSEEILMNPRVFNSQDLSIDKSGFALKKDNFSEYSDSFGTVKSFKKMTIDKDRISGVVRSNIKTLSIVEREGTNFITVRSFDSDRDSSNNVSNSIDSIKIRIDKSKEKSLPVLVCALMERNLLK